MKEKDNTNSTIKGHKIKSFNFEFMLNTELNDYYEKLIDDEIIFNKKPTNEKIYMDCRVIAEHLVNMVSTKLLNNNGNRYLPFYDRLEKIKSNMPYEINKNFYNIRINGNNYGHPDSPPYSVTVEEVFREVHTCLLWYFKKMDLGLDEIYDVDFVIPNHKTTGENEKRYFELIDQQKVDYVDLTRKFEEAERKISDKDEEIEKLRANAKNIVKKNHKMFSEKNMELERLKNELNIMHSGIESENLKRSLRESEEDLAKSSIKNDLLNETLLKLSNAPMGEVKNEFIVDEDINKIKDLSESISEDLENVTKKIEKTSSEIKSFKEILQENNNIKFSRYSTFYKTFLKLEGEQLKKVYVTLEKLNIATLLITTIKNKFNKSDIDEMQKFIDKEASKLNSYSDEEIKFKLYYKLMKLCNIDDGCLANDKEFKGNLDKIVKFAYSTLQKKKDFKVSGDELETINAYYMNKIISDFEVKFNDSSEEIQKELIDNIYNNFEKLPEEQKKQLYDKLNIKNASEDAVKASMKTIGPSFMLSTLVGLGGFASYTTLSSIIFGFSHLLGVTFSFGVYTGAASLLSFLTGPFMIILLIADGFFVYGQGKKQKVDLVPMIIMQICVSETTFNADNNYEIKYKNLVGAWKEKRNSFVLKKNMKTKTLHVINEINENKEEIESECSKETNVLESLNLKFAQEKDSFKYILLNSPKRNSLKSYKEYDENDSKLKLLTYKSNKNNGLGFFSKIVSKVKDGTQEYIIKKKIKDLENVLVLEALESDSFYSNTINIKDTEKEIKEKETNIRYIKGKIEEETKKLNFQKQKLTNIENEIKDIKGEFGDIDNILEKS